LDLISVAGGFTDKASRAITVTHRPIRSHTVTVKLPADFTPSDPSNVVVEPGDTIVVKRGPGFYVVGDVGQPSAFISDSENLTILKAIALAGGANKTAAMGGTTILRRNAGRHPANQVPLKKIMSAKVKDMPMQSEDILFVPSSTRKGRGGTLRGSAHADGYGVDSGGHPAVNCTPPQKGCHPNQRVSTAMSLPKGDPAHSILRSPRTISPRAAVITGV